MIDKKTTRVQLELSAKSIERPRRFQEEREATSYAEVIRNLLAEEEKRVNKRKKSKMK